MTYFQTDPDIQQISSTRNKFAESFSGVAAAAGQPSVDALTARGWSVLRNSGVTVTLNNGSLVLGLGTASGNEFLMVGPARQTIPANLTATFLMSQRIAGNEVRFGYVAVDPFTGLPIPHATLPGFFANFAAMLFSSTTGATGRLEASADSIGTVRQVASGNTMTATSAACDYSMEVRNEDITLVSSVADDVAIRASGAIRISSVVPDIQLVYAPFVWVRNNGAAASNTNVTLNRIVSLDIQELQAEVGGGRGNQTPSQSVPVVVTGGAAAGINVTVVGSTGSSATNGLSGHRLISAATTNATSVKASQGRVFGGSVSNTSAAWRYIKFFSKNSAPVLGTDTPVATVGIPPNSTVGLGAIFDQYGMHFSAGIAYALTTGAADADTGAVGANEVVVTILFA